ncbi:MAG: UDP-glucose dehydrogenase family protein [Candidatus Hodarchaeales archaeon]|jgi:UDPglucose 6-dehydrogenase
MNKNTVTVIGMGHLGLPLAVTFAMSGFKVYAMDIDEKKINFLNNGKSPFQETGLEDALQNLEIGKNFIPTTNLESSIKDSIASFILVNTPSNPDGSYGLHFVESVAESLGRILKNIDFYHTIVEVSTVSPGDCLKYILPLIESESGKICGEDFGFVHNPEFIALGSVLSDMLHPDFRIIGDFDKKSGDIVEEIYKKVSNDPILRMGINNAELVKIALNCYLTIKISFANTLGEICEKMEGGDANLVTKALGLDKRISPKFLKAGLGYGGPCFPRDDKALIALAKKLNAQAFLSEASSKVNNRQVSITMEKIRTLKNIKDITVLGLSYKPNVPYVTESQAFEITKILSEDSKYNVTVFDPQAISETKKILKTKVNYAENLETAINIKSDLVLVLTPWKEFENIDFKGKKVLNLW